MGMSRSGIENLRPREKEKLRNLADLKGLILSMVKIYQKGLGEVRKVVRKRKGGTA